ncbi:hypothetical protein, partial [Hymenobacter sp. AT01-02]|uniref:hypothetical protein n=1 Tax=Hymenobacter sp. AT01-02 TaxID=1571877 RepID=UPI000A82E634
MPTTQSLPSQQPLLAMVALLLLQTEHATFSSASLSDADQLPHLGAAGYNQETLLLPTPLPER